MSVSILTVVPARAGSKAVPDKNLRPLGDAPLIAHVLRTVARSRFKMRTLVSTDSEEIAALARVERAEVPFLRPPELARDEVSLIPVVRHALAFCRGEGEAPDLVVSLQPTAPFTPVAALDRAIQRVIEDPEIDSAVSVTLIRRFHPYRAYALGADGRLEPFTEYTTERYLQRQDRPPAYAMTGGFYVRRPELLDAWDDRGFALGARVHGEEVDEFGAVDVNTPLDFLLAEAILAHRGEVRRTA